MILRTLNAYGKTIHKHLLAVFYSMFSHHNNGPTTELQMACCMEIKKVQFFILVTEHWAQSWSRCTDSQPACDFSSHPGGRLPLLSARPAVTFPAEKRHHPSTSTKLYCLVTEAHRYKQLAQGCMQLCPSGNWTKDLLIASSTPYCYININKIPCPLTTEPFCFWL